MQGKKIFPYSSEIFWFYLFWGIEYHYYHYYRLYHLILASSFKFLLEYNCINFLFVHRFRGVVVITSALHAEGLRFDPGRNLPFLRF